METVFVRTESNTILQMDIDPHDDEGRPTTIARERFDEKLAKGQLQLVDADDVKKIANGDGTGYFWIDKHIDEDEYHEQLAERRRARSTHQSNKAPVRGVVPPAPPAHTTATTPEHNAPAGSERRARGTSKPE
jgi:hypothetical protein